MPDPHVQIDDDEPLFEYAVGVTPQSAFIVPFAFFNTSEIKVRVDGELQDDDDYTVTGTAGNSRGYPGGTLTFDTAVSDCTVTIYSKTPVERTSDHSPSGPLDINTLNTDLDRGVRRHQELEMRSLRFEFGDSVAPIQPVPNVLLGLDAATELSLYPIDTDVQVTGLFPNVLKYGARGNDPTFDDLPGFQAAAAFAIAAGLGGINVPGLGTGRYYFKSGYLNSRNLSIIGLGAEATIVQTTYGLPCILAWSSPDEPVLIQGIRTVNPHYPKAVINNVNTTDFNGGNNANHCAGIYMAGTGVIDNCPSENFVNGVVAHQYRIFTEPELVRRTAFAEGSTTIWALHAEDQGRATDYYKDWVLGIFMPDSATPIQWRRITGSTGTTVSFETHAMPPEGADSYHYILRLAGRKIADPATVTNTTAVLDAADVPVGATETTFNDYLYKAWGSGGAGSTRPRRITSFNPATNVITYDTLAPRDLVTNGTFDADEDWTKGTGWTIAAGVASCDGSQVDVTDLEQTAEVDITDSYEVTYTVVVTAGSITPIIGGTAGTARTASGTYTETIEASSTEDFIFRGSAAFIGTLDDVEILNVTALSVIAGTAYYYTLKPPATGRLTLRGENHSRVDFGVLYWHQNDICFEGGRSSDIEESQGPPPHHHYGTGDHGVEYSAKRVFYSDTPTCYRNPNRTAFKCRNADLFSFDTLVGEDCIMVLALGSGRQATGKSLVGKRLKSANRNNPAIADFRNTTNVDIEHVYGEISPDHCNVSNSEFDTDEDWTKGVGWTINNGLANSDGTQVAVSDLSQAHEIRPGGSYPVRFKVAARSAGTITPIIGGKAGTPRAAAGSFLETIIADIVTNGVFAADTDWTKGAGWTIAGDVASRSLAAASTLSQAVTLVNGGAYRIKFSLEVFTAGTITPVIGGVAGTARGEVGVFTEAIVAGATDIIEFQASDDFVGSIDNVMVSFDEIAFQASANFVGSIDNVTVAGLGENSGPQMLAVYNGSFGAQNIAPRNIRIGTAQLVLDGGATLQTGLKMFATGTDDGAGGAATDLAVNVSVDDWDIEICNAFTALTDLFAPAAASRAMIGPATIHHYDKDSNTTTLGTARLKYNQTTDDSVTTIDSRRGTVVLTEDNDDRQNLERGNRIVDLARPAPGNLINNCYFRNWSLGTSFTPLANTRTAIADGWHVGRNAADYTVSRQAAIAASGAAFVVRLQRNVGTAGTGHICLHWKLTDAQADLIARIGTVTVRADILAGATFSSADSLVRCRVFTGTGTGETPDYLGAFTTGSAVAGPYECEVSAALTECAWQFAIPAGATEMNLTLSWTPVGTAGATDYIDVTNVYLTAGQTTIQLSPDQLSGTLTADGIETISNKTIVHADGTAAAPSAAFGGTANGFYSPAANEFAWAAGTTERARFNATGQLVFGHTVSLAFGSATNPRVQIHGINNQTATLAIANFDTAAGVASLRLARSRSGTIGTFGGTALASGSDMGAVQWFGDNLTAFAFAAEILVEATETWSAAAHGTRMVGSLTVNGATTPTEIYRFDHATGFSMFGTNPVIDQNRHHMLRSYTVVQLPATPAAGSLAYCSNETGGAVVVFGDGTNWRRVTDRAIAS